MIHLNRFAKSSLVCSPQVLQNIILSRIRLKRKNLNSDENILCQLSIHSITEMTSKATAMDDFDTNFNKLSKVLDGNNGHLLKHLQLLHDECKNILSFAHEYDFDENTPNNGYRTFVKLIAIYFDKLAASYEGRSSRKRIQRQKELGFLAELFAGHLSVLQVLRHKKTGLDASDWGQDNSIDQQVHQKLLSITTEQLEVLYNKFTRGFWLPKGLRRFMCRIYSPLMILMIFPFKMTFKNMFNGEIGKKIYADFALNASAADVKNFWAAGDSSTMKIIARNGRGTCKTMKFVRQKEWALDKEGKLIRNQPEEVNVEEIDNKNNNTRQNKKTVHDTSLDKKDPTTYVKVLYIHYGRKGQSPSDSIVFHSHGGGFLATTPDMHTNHLRKLSKKLRVPVLSVYYRLAPEYPYPAALQDILDAYLYLVSENDRLQSLLGFLPQNIVLIGDSAGGNLSVALTLVLNDIRKQCESIKMPTSLSIQYPGSNLFPGSCSASRSLSMFDNLVEFGMLYSVFVAYVGETIDCENKASITTGVKPWYRQGSEVVDKIISKYENKVSDPYFNILCSTHYEDLKDIKLFIQASELDPHLDDAVQIAKKWKGFVKLDVIPDVNHGFLAFQDFSVEAKRGAAVTAKRTGQGLGIIKMDHEETL